MTFMDAIGPLGVVSLAVMGGLMLSAFLRIASAIEDIRDELCDEDGDDESTEERPS